MEKKNFSDAIIAQTIEKEAWKELSEQFAWNEEMLLKHQDDVDWEAISGNRNIIWSVKMLERFNHEINWRVLSDCSNEYAVTINTLEKFRDKWHWDRVSSNIDDDTLSFELIDKFIDLWNWNELINHWHCSIYSIDFLERYQAYIPADKLQDSHLWRAIVEKRAKQLKAELLKS